MALVTVYGDPGPGSSGTAYYPLITPSSNTTLYYTMGCDNVGGIQYGIVPSAASPPTAATNWVNMAQGIGFPGINNWTVLGIFAPRTYMWFKCDFRDGGGAYAFTFAISTTPSMAGVLTHSRMLLGFPGKPYYRG